MAPSRCRARGIDVSSQYSTRPECPRRASVDPRLAVDIEDFGCDEASTVTVEDHTETLDRTVE